MGMRNINDGFHFRRTVIAPSWAIRNQPSAVVQAATVNDSNWPKAVISDRWRVSYKIMVSDYNFPPAR